MASRKKQRKDRKASQKPQASPAGPFRHPDGDRRHRESGPAYRDAMATKESLKFIGAVDLPPEGDEGSR